LRVPAPTRKKRREGGKKKGGKSTSFKQENELNLARFLNLIEGGGVDCLWDSRGNCGGGGDAKNPFLRMTTFLVDFSYLGKG